MRIHPEFPWALYIHAGYDDVWILLSQPHQIVASITLKKSQASSLLIHELQALLHEHQLQLHTAQWIGAHVGPAPFTTLRTVLATLNGMAHIQPLPLIGVSGMRVWAQMHPERVVILNAFCGDIYLGYYTQDEYHEQCVSVSEGISILETLSIQRDNHRVQLMGNGAQLYQAELREKLGDRIDSIADAPREVSPVWCAEHVWAHASEYTHQKQLFPLYLKDATSTLVPYTPLKV